jgi:hypothetical protein
MLKVQLRGGKSKKFVQTYQRRIRSGFCANYVLWTSQRCFPQDITRSIKRTQDNHEVIRFLNRIMSFI